MKVFISISTLALIPLLLNAQVTITGKVTEKKTGEPIPGAVIFLPEIEKGAYTDKDGVYRLGNLPRINAKVQVTYLGYKSIVENVDLSGTSSLNFEMEEAITEINEVEITGTSRATEIARNPVPVVTLDIKDLHQNINNNIIDAISKLPGINAVTTGPNISKPFIHGLGYNRVLTLYDGIRQEGQQWGDEHGIEIDENSVDHVEIIKGPASLEYGSDAIAGVVNLLPAPHVANDTILGRFDQAFNTNNFLISTSVSLAGNRNGFVWGGVASHKLATNYRNRYDGRVFNTAFNETDLSGYLGINKNWGVSDVHFSFFNDLQEIPDGSRDSLTRKFTKQITEADTFRPVVSERELNSCKIGAIHQHVQFFRIYSSNNLIVGKSRLILLLGYQQSIRREYSHPQYPDVPGLFLDLNTFTYETKYSIPEKKGWEVTVGVNGMWQNNSNKGTEFVIPDYKLFDIGPFVLISKKIKNLNISAGIRLDERIFNNEVMYVRTNPLNGFEMQVNLPDTAGSSQLFNKLSNRYSGLSASFGATYNFTRKLLLKANVARGYRAPNIAEISANGVHPGTLIYQIGNNNLKPEFNLQEDLEISYRSDHVSGYIDLFNNNITNYIFNNKVLNHLRQDSVVVKGNQTFKFQQVRAKLYGWEAYIDIHPFDWLHFENSVSVVYAINKGNHSVIVQPKSKYPPLIPPLHSSSELRANLNSKYRKLKSIFFKVGFELYAKQDRVYSENNTETRTPGYVLLNIGAGTDVVNYKGKTILSFIVLGNNITDKAYQSHLSRLKYLEEFPHNLSGRSGIYNMGRNISFKLSVPLDFRYK